MIPYARMVFDEAGCADEGYWDAEAADPYIYKSDERGEIKLIYDPTNAAVGCFRFDGDDGPFDIQPTHWMPL